MPAQDWQFWVVTGLAIVAVYVVIRSILPRRAARRRKHAELTIGGQRRK